MDCLTASLSMSPEFPPPTARIEQAEPGGTRPSGTCDWPGGPIRTCCGELWEVGRIRALPARWAWVFPSITHKRVLNENTFSQVQRGNICRSRAAAWLCQKLSAQVYVWCRPFSSASELSEMLWNWSKEVCSSVYGSLKYDCICVLPPPCVLEDNYSYLRFKCIAYLEINYVACHVHSFHFIKCPNHLFQSVLQHYQNPHSLWYYSYKCEMRVLSLIFNLYSYLPPPPCHQCSSCQVKRAASEVTNDCGRKLLLSE